MPARRSIRSRRTQNREARFLRSSPDQDLLRRRRRMPGGHALHGDTAERRRHPVPVPPGLRGNPSQRESRGPVDVLGAVHRHSPPHVARRAMRRVRDERPLRGLPRPGLWDDRRPDGRRSSLHSHSGHVRRVATSPLANPGGRSGAPAGTRRRGRDRVRPRIAGDDRLGRCGRGADEEDPRVRPGHGRSGPSRSPAARAASTA